MQLHQTMCCRIFGSVGQWMMAWPTPDRGPSARLGWVAQCSLARWPNAQLYCRHLQTDSCSVACSVLLHFCHHLQYSNNFTFFHCLTQSENISVLVNFASVLVFFIISINLIFWVFMCFSLCFQTTVIVIVMLWAVSCARSPRLIWIKGH